MTLTENFQSIIKAYAQSDTEVAGEN